MLWFEQVNRGTLLFILSASSHGRGSHNSRIPTAGSLTVRIWQGYRPESTAAALITREMDRVTWKTGCPDKIWEWGISSPIYAWRNSMYIRLDTDKSSQEQPNPTRREISTRTIKQIRFNPILTLIVHHLDKILSLQKIVIWIGTQKNIC